MLVRAFLPFLQAACRACCRADPRVASTVEGACYQSLFNGHSELMNPGGR